MGRHKDTKLNTDNRGVTLVEVVVSLLILMIIVVPILSGFISATKSNRKSKEVIYANTACENVMEAVKVLGIEETAREFSDCGLRSFSVVPDGTSDRYYEMAVTGGSLSIATDVDGSKKFVPLTGNGTYQYRIDGVQEGTDKYDVDITISAADVYSENNGPNSYRYADLTAFSSDSIAVINPVIQGSSYDNKALAYFSNMNTRIMNKRYSDACASIDRQNREAMDIYEAEKAAGGNPVPPVILDYPPASNYAPLSILEVSKCISKKVVVKIEEITDAAGKSQYVLNSEIIYSCINKGTAGTPPLPLFSEDTDKYPINDDAHPIEREPYNGYCRDQRYSSLDTVMLVYKPFNDISELHKETIEVKKDTSKKMDLYIAMQGEEDTDFNSITNKPNLILNDVQSTGFVLYSQVDFNISGSVPPVADVHKSLIADLPAGNKLYNISVKVYENGSSYSKLVAQVDSTMLDD